MDNLKTITIDSINGEMNSEFELLEKKTRENLRSVINEYIKDCINNNIETCSADGFLFELIFQTITEQRLYISYERKKNAENNIS